MDLLYRPTTRSRPRRGLLAIALIAGLTSAALFTSTASAQESTTWRVQSHWPTASSSYEGSLVRIKNIIEERTDGRVKLKLYPAGALFKGEQTFDAVKRGIIQMGTISPAYAQNQMSLAGIASGLPFAFRNVWEAAYFHKGLGFEDMLRAEAAEHGVYYSTDKVYPTEMVVNKPIQSMADFKGLKIRSSGALETFLTDAGASASYIPGSELYTALSSGVVDGAHWGAAQGASSMSLYEVAPYHVKPALNIAGTDAFIVNQKALDELSKADAKTVRDALNEQFWYRTNEYQYLEQLALAKEMATNDVQITTLPPEVQDQLTQIAQKSWKKMGERSDNAAEALSRLREMLANLGYIEAS